MKKLLILLFLFISSISFAQDTTIVSIRLDSLIFEKINEYRSSKNVEPFESFEYSSIREFSYNRTITNSKLSMIRHSPGQPIVYNVECIYLHKRTGPNWLSNVIETENYNIIADMIVNSWIKSASHEKGISADLYKHATITSIITVNSKTDDYRIDISYHASY